MKVSKFGDCGLFLALVAGIVLVLIAGPTIPAPVQAQVIKKNPNPTLQKHRCYVPKPATPCATGFKFIPPGRCCTKLIGKYPSA